MQKNAGGTNLPDLCIAASSIAAGRGVGVHTARPRLSTRTQCTIRATARDRESHAGAGYRKRFGVTCGRSLCRGHCGGGLSSYMPQRAFCLTDEARMSWGGGVRRPNAESSAGSGISLGIRGSMGDRMRELTRRMCTEGLIGYLSDLLNLPGTRNDICILVAIFSHMH